MKTSLWISCLMLLTGFLNIETVSMQQDPIMLHKITGEGKPLVLVPGGLTGWISWDPFVTHFSKEKKVIQVQLLNVQYGLENKNLPANYTVRTESKALEAALISANLHEKADFIGWSFGGLVLLDYALNHPEKIRTLTLIEPPALWIIKKDIEKDPELRKALDFMSSFPGPDKMITEDDLERFLNFAGFSKPGVSVRDIPQWKGWLNFRQSLRNTRAVQMHDDDPERVRKFPAPVLLVKGTGSAHFLHRIIDALDDNFPHAQVVEYQGGHAAHLVSRDQFLEAIDSFQR
ncbi:MAG: alpha/beta hydrolase [Cyclobacteriaceae bacterium]